MEYAPGGELSLVFKKYRVQMHKDGKLIESIRQYLAEILVALEYLHKLNIVYRDLKLENIVITSNGHLKLVDFGFSKKLHKHNRTYTRCGTKGYAAPEIVQDLGHDISSDVWSFGVILCQMISGSIDNKEVDTKKVFRLISDEPEAKDLIIKCLSKFPENRPSIKTIMQHKFFTPINWKKVRNLELDHYFIPEIPI